MKKKILLFTAISSIAILSLTSGLNGAGAEKGYDCTGAETVLGNVNGCAASGAACHGSAGVSTAGITLTLELDSAGISRSFYMPGNSYTVKISATNTTANHLPYFGFQVACIKGITSISSGTPVNAGAFASTGLPARVRYTAAIPGYFDCNVVEHSDTIRATTGTGGTGSTYVESFGWTAPAAGTGKISFWGVLNAVNGDNLADIGDKWNTTHITIAEGPGILGANNLQNKAVIKAFPNPVLNTLNLQFDNAQDGNYEVSVYDMTGRKICSQSIAINLSGELSVNTANWTPGLYHVIVVNGDCRQVLAVVK